MENASEKLYSILQDLASQMGAKDLSFSVEKPKDQSHGDLASNIAMVLAQKLGKKPMDIAHEMAEKVVLEKDIIADIKIVPPRVY